MDIQLKQRLVGIAVIFSLAIIFLPMLLDGSGRVPRQLDIEIPPSPEMQSEHRVEEKVIELRKQVAEIPKLEPVIVDEISEPPQPEAEPETEAQKEKPVAVVEKKPTAQAEPPVEVKPAAEPPRSETKTEKSLVGGDTWVIQVGSFQDKSKAYKERDRLRKSKMSAVFIERFDNKGVPSYRVRMGPFLNEDKARVINNKILAKYNIKGLVMKYEK
jgi:DedD protein